jgi:hypothetical protein
LALIGQVKDVKQKPEKGHHVKDPPNYLLAGVDFMEVQAQDHVQRPGLARLAASKTKHGRYTKIEKAKAKARAQIGREIWKELKEIENWCIEHGHLKKNWRKDFYI